MSVFTFDKDTLAVLDTFLFACFYVSNEANFQNYFANKLMIRWFVIEAIPKTRSTCFKRYKTSKRTDVFVKRALLE